MLTTSWQAPDPQSAPSTVLAVADGMGGAEGGAIASGIAVAVVAATCGDPGRRAGLADDRDWREAFGQMFAAATSRMRRKVLEDDDLRRMGTTLTVLLLGGNSARWAHVGDSRVYLFRDDQLRQVTTDHNAARELVESGQIAADLAPAHRSRHVLTRWLSPDWPPLAPECAAVESAAGDVWLVCSDGLYAMVPEARIVEALRAASAATTQDELGAHADFLVACANDAGGRDNISLALGLHVHG